MCVGKQSFNSISVYYIKRKVLNRIGKAYMLFNQAKGIDENSPVNIMNGGTLKFFSLGFGKSLEYQQTVIFYILL